MGSWAKSSNILPRRDDLDMKSLLGGGQQVLAADCGVLCRGSWPDEPASLLSWRAAPIACGANYGHSTPSMVATAVTTSLSGRRLLRFRNEAAVTTANVVASTIRSSSEALA